MGTKFQEFETSFDISRAYREVQRADKDFANGKADAAAKRLEKGYKYFASACNHLAKAEEDAYNKAGDKIGKGNSELQRSIDAYADGNVEKGARYYNEALTYYDEALDIVD